MQESKTISHTQETSQPVEADQKEQVEDTVDLDSLFADEEDKEPQQTTKKDESKSQDTSNTKEEETVNKEDIS